MLLLHHITKKSLCCKSNIIFCDICCFRFSHWLCLSFLQHRAGLWSTYRVSECCHIARCQSVIAFDWDGAPGIHSTRHAEYCSLFFILYAGFEQFCIVFERERHLRCQSCDLDTERFKDIQGQRSRTICMFAIDQTTLQVETNTRRDERLSRFKNTTVLSVDICEGITDTTDLSIVSVCRVCFTNVIWDYLTRVKSNIAFLTIVQIFGTKCFFQDGAVSTSSPAREERPRDSLFLWNVS